MNTLRLSSSCFLMLAVVLGTGCASLFGGENSTEDSSAEAPEVAEVAGIYEIQHYEFIPQASALDPIDLLKYVEEESSALELTQSQDFILTYRTQDGEEVKLTGPFKLTSDLVTLEGQEKDEARFKRILLDRTLSLDRATESTLRFENQTEITPEALGSWYEGMNQVRGTLRLEFEQEEESIFGFN